VQFGERPINVIVRNDREFKMPRRKPVVYLSAAMSGVPYFNYPAFDAMAARFRAAGWSVVSPADHDRHEGIEPDPEGRPVSAAEYARLIRWDVSALMTCDAICMLKGWQSSRGADLEHKFAVALGLRIMYEEGIDL